MGRKDINNIKWRRNKVLELVSKGHNQSILFVDLTTNEPNFMFNRYGMVLPYPSILVWLILQPTSEIVASKMKVQYP